MGVLGIKWLKGYCLEQIFGEKADQYFQEVKCGFGIFWMETFFLVRLIAIWHKRREKVSQGLWGQGVIPKMTRVAIVQLEHCMHKRPVLKKCLMGRFM